MSELTPEVEIDDIVRVPFEVDDGYSTGWWGPTAKGVSFTVWLRFDDDVLGYDVARAKLVTNSDLGGDYPTWDLPAGGAVEVELLEVHRERRGHHFGSQAVSLICERFAGPYVAMSFDEDSDLFWRSVGWREHRPTELPGGSAPRRLFSKE